MFDKRGSLKNNELPECDMEPAPLRLPAVFNHSGTNVGSLLSITSAKHYHIRNNE